VKPGCCPVAEVCGIANDLCCGPGIPCVNDASFGVAFCAPQVSDISLYSLYIYMYTHIYIYIYMYEDICKLVLQQCLQVVVSAISMVCEL
jgi:hypothetical protein